MEYLDKGGPAMATRNKISNPVNGPGYRVAGRLVHPSKATIAKVRSFGPGPTVCRFWPSICSSTRPICAGR